MKAGVVQMSQAAVRSGDLTALVKPRITLMVLITMAAGAFLARPGDMPFLRVIEALFATGVLASAASALNQVLEVREDALMKRTADRPLAAGRLDRSLVLAAASAATVVSLLLLAWRVNPLTAALGAFTSFAYLFLYTPLKKRSPLSTIVGAVPGALPPVMGWAAAVDRLDFGAWILFGVVFLWQIPHFLAIAWMYRDDYERGGFPVLPVLDRSGRATAVMMVAFTLLLVALTVVAPRAGLGGTIHLIGALLAGGTFLAVCVGFARAPGHPAARRVLLGSVLYLPIVLGATLLDYLPPF